MCFVYFNCVIFVLLFDVTLCKLGDNIPPISRAQVNNCHSLERNSIREIYVNRNQTNTP